MGMGTASCFPADVCAAVPAPPEPPTGAGHPASIAATTGAWVPPLSPSLSLGRGGAGPCWGTGPVCPGTALATHCLLRDVALTSTPKPPWCPHIHPSAPPPVTASHPWHPTLSITLHTPPTSLPHPYLSPPTIPSPLGVYNWVLPPTWPGGSWLGGSWGGRTRGQGRSQEGKYGDQGEDAANSTVGQAPGPGATRGGTPGPQQHLQGRRRKSCGIQLPALWG